MSEPRRKISQYAVLCTNKKATFNSEWEKALLEGLEPIGPVQVVPLGEDRQN